MSTTKKVLFVDDEVHLLEGLKRLLRPQRREWDMFFALGAEEALALLARTPVDVVVTDMRMPGMDGASLLERIHHDYPNIMRIILSGHCDVEAGMRAVPVAHQFLIKPCDPDRLKAAIERSSHGNNKLLDEATRRVVNAIGALPSPPKTCVILLETINDPAASMGSISEIVNQDVALAAKVLQLVNSAFFSLPHEVTDVKMALTALGMDVLKQLVLSAEIVKRFQPVRPVRGFSLEEFERHSRMSARIAGLLPTLREVQNFCIMAALLHDTGKLILATHLPGKFGKACWIATSEKCKLHEAERRVFGTSHAEIGAYLLNLWGLPQIVVDAIATHHRPLAAENGPDGLDLNATVYIANALAHDCDRADGTTPVEDLDQSYIESLGVADKLSAWREAARRTILV